MAEQIISPGFRFYQSANTDAAIIKEDFIIRLQEFNIIMEDIRRNPMNGSVQHYLLIGRRGSGKSTLLRRIQAEIESDEVLSKTHVAINLAEEQANIYRLHDLLEEIIQELEHEGIPIALPAWDGEQKYSRELFKAIHAAIEKSGKKIVLLLDNIDRIFENLHEDASLLREYLLNFDDIKIIGGSTKMTEHFWQYNKPFYEFFRVLELKKLTSDEVKQLLLYWAEKLNMPQLKEFVENKSGQIETVRILTDGLPRTLQFFVNILLTRTQESGYEYLRLIMDQVTPLYQELLNTLPPAQRKVVLKLAFIWEAAGAKDIAAATHMDNKVVSAQLKQLSDKGIVEKLETKTKNHLYRLTERFFNLWLIFTQGNPHEKRKAKCLTIFLENFYDAEELREIATSHLSLLKDGNLEPNRAALLTKAVAQSKHISSYLRDQLIIKTLELKGIEDEIKKQLPYTTHVILTKVGDFIKKEEWNSAITALEDIDQQDGLKEIFLGFIYYSSENWQLAEANFLLGKEKGQSINIDAYLGIIYSNQEKFNLAEKYFLSALKEDSPSFEIYYFLASVYFETKQYGLAEKYFKIAIDKGDMNSIHALASLYHEQKKYQLAEEFYFLSIQKGDKDAIYSLGTLYQDQEKNDLAEKYYLQSIENNDTDAMLQLAILYYNQTKYYEAEKYCKMAVEKDVVGSLSLLGGINQRLDKIAEAEKYYMLALNKGDSDAYGLLGELYHRLNRYEDAVNYFNKAIANGKLEVRFNLALLYYEQNENKELSLKLIKEHLKIYPDDIRAQSFSVTVMVWNAKFKEAFKLLERLIEAKEYEYLQLTFTDLIVHGQTNYLLNLFSDSIYSKDLIENFYPIIYILLKLNSGKDDLDLKLPPELKEPVNKLLNNVKQQQNIYYPK